MIADILRDAINLYWLRPENGLALASYVIHGTDLTPRKNMKYADFACGDGVNTFFKSGGRFDQSFDIFQSVVTGESVQAVAEQGIDVYDNFDNNYAPAIVQKPLAKYHIGTDHKESLLSKARNLDFYEKLFLKDLREELQEIADETLDFIYCNSLYWVKETEFALHLMKKKLTNDGKMVFDVFTKNKSKLDWGLLFPEGSKTWRTLLNRGRQDTNPGLKTEKEWEDLFQNNGLSIDEKRNILPSSIAQIWNLGLRPIFPLLHRMTLNIESSDRMQIKKEWVDTFCELLLPILEHPDSFSKDSTKYRIQYILIHK